MKNICVFSIAYDVGEKYKKATRELGELIVKNNFNLVWGGTNKGLMKVIADSVQSNGGKIFGVTMEALKKNRRMNADEMIITKNISERKKTLLSKSDSFVLLSGGIGGLDETTEILELKKEKLHNKPIIFLNTDNFYGGLKILFKRMKKDGFIEENLDDLIFFADTPQKAINYIKSYK
jgi:hypothetical protein